MVGDLVGAVEAHAGFEAWVEVVDFTEQGDGLDFADVWGRSWHTWLSTAWMAWRRRVVSSLSVRATLHG